MPKQIALRDPEAVAVRVAPAMTWLARISSPVVWLLDKSGDAILFVLGQRGEPSERVTEDEIHSLIVEAENAGVLEPGEREMIAGVMRLGDRPVGAVMTPRHEVGVIDLAASREAVREAILKSPHSRMPVIDGDREHVLGVVHAKELLDAWMTGGEPDIRALVREAPVIPDSADARDVLAILKASPVHIGLVHDEYGVFEGVVTAADILQSIVGDFNTGEETERAAVQRDDGSWLISGWMPIDEFGALLRIAAPQGRAYHTVAGFMLQNFGALPAVGESFDAQGWRFEVIDLDGRRIDKILATPLERRRRAG